MTSWQMAIRPSKLGVLYRLSSELFSRLKCSLFPKGLTHDTFEQWSFSGVRRKWRLAKRLRVSKQKPHWFVLFLVWFLYDKTPNRWKDQLRCNLFPLWKNISFMSIKFAFIWGVFLYRSTTALLSPRFLKMKYCSFGTCVRYWLIARNSWFSRDVRKK